MEPRCSNEAGDRAARLNTEGSRMVATKQAQVAQGSTSADGWQADVERLVGRVRQGVRDSWSDFTTRPRKAVDDVVKEARRFRSDLQKRAEQVVRRAQQRSSRVMDSIEGRFTSTFGPVTKRFDVASQRDVDALSRRVADLEKRVDNLGKSAKAA